MKSTLRVRHPSLLRRVVLIVLAAFAVAFVLLFLLIGWGSVRRETGEFDIALLLSARTTAKALDAVPDDDAARAFSVLAQATSVSVSAGDDFAPLMAAQRLDASQPAIGEALDVALANLPNGFSTLHHKDTLMRVYTATGALWRVVLLDDEKRRVTQILLQLGPELALYLSLAVPIVLLPVLWAVRAALKPLQDFSDRVAARAPADTSPLHMPRAFRELLPLEVALNRLFEKVGHGVAREKAFVHDAAHELRTPLAVISAQAHVLANLPNAENQATVELQESARQEARQHLEAAVARASHLTQQLLQLAQADASATATRQPVDVMNLVRDSLATFARRAEEQGTELALAGPDSAVHPCDPHALRSIIDNLVDNALRYGGPGGAIEVQVVTGGVPTRPGCVLTVSDCGPGITPTLHEQVFERFWRGKTEHQRGAGLGLAIVREAARSLGGTAEVLDTAAGAGCTVRVHLP